MPNAQSVKHNAMHAKLVRGFQSLLSPNIYQATKQIFSILTQHKSGHSASLSKLSLHDEGQEFI